MSTLLVVHWFSSSISLHINQHLPVLEPCSSPETRTASSLSASKPPFHSTFISPKCFLSQTSLMLFPHPNSQKKTLEIDQPSRIGPIEIQKFSPNPAHSNSCGSSLQNCFGSSSGSADLNGWWCPWLGQQYQWWGYLPKGMDAQKTRELGKLPIFKTNHVVPKANRDMVLMVQRYWRHPA